MLPSGTGLGMSLDRDLLRTHAARACASMAMTIDAHHASRRAAGGRRRPSSCCGSLVARTRGQCDAGAAARARVAGVRRNARRRPAEGHTREPRASGCRLWTWRGGGSRARAAAGSSRWLEAVLDPLAEFLRPISPIAWIPIAILMFGVGRLVPIFLIFYAVAVSDLRQHAGRHQPRGPQSRECSAVARRFAHDGARAHDRSRRRCLRSLPARGSRSASPGCRWSPARSSAAIPGSAGAFSGTRSSSRWTA